MTVLNVPGDSNFGGAAESVLRLAQLWKSAGWEARILTSDPVFQGAAGDSGTGFIDLDCMWIRLWRRLKSERVTVVHTHSTKAGFIGRIATRMASVPIVIHTVHGFAFHERSSRVKIIFYTVLEKIAARCCDRIVTVSRFHRDWAVRLRIAPAEKLRAIPNGIPDIAGVAEAGREELQAIRNTTARDNVILTAGRFAHEKGLEDLLAAVAQVRERLSSRLYVVLAGNGPSLPELERRVRRLGLSGHRRFLGFRKDIGALLQIADPVVLPSLREGLSIALAEAMPASIVATSIAKNLEVLKGPIAAALITPLEHLAGDPALRKQLGIRARQRWEAAYTIDRAQHAYQEYRRP